MTRKSYRFELLCQTKKGKQVSDMLQHLDIIRGEICEKEIVTFTSDSDYNIQYYKDGMKKFLEEQGYTVFSIKGGIME